MSVAHQDVPDVMQVCYNGHVVTDLLRSCPHRGLSNCDQCGAATLDHCLTCGRELTGAIPVTGVVGSRRPPEHCQGCGAPFPWTARPQPAVVSGVAALESALRRLPQTIRELRYRQTDRPTFRVEDQRDLEDLLRAVLPLCFDGIRPHSRTPRYSPATQTDFLIVPQQLALTAKIVASSGQEAHLREQWQEDVAYYRSQPNCGTLMCFSYDPHGLLTEPRSLESVLSRSEDGLELRWIIADG
jgi:hypothetical protein